MDPQTKLNPARRSIRWRIAMMVGMVVLLASTCGIILTDAMVASTLRTDLEEKYLSLARNLATTLITPVLTNNEVRVRILLKSLKHKEKDIVYAFVTSQDNRVIGHTLTGRFPPDLLRANPIAAGNTVSIRKLSTEEGIIKDMALPLLNGSAGSLHLGISDRRLALELVRMRLIYLSSALILSIVGFGIAFILSGKIAHPLEELAECAEEVGRGNLTIRIKEPESDDETGRLARIFNRMVTDLRKNQDEIEEKNATLAFRNLILTTQQENALDGILVFDRNGRVVSHNRHFLEIWQSDKETMVGMDDRDVLQEMVTSLKDPEQLLGLGLNFYKDQANANRKHLITREGRVIDCYSSPMTGPYGTSYGRVIYSRDITEKARAEEAMAREKELLEVTLASIGDGVICTDLNGRVTMINAVAATLIGRKKHQAEGRRLEDIFNIINEKTRRTANNPVARVITSGRIQGLANHTILIAADGQEYRIADSAAPIRDPDGKIIGVVMVFRDITMQHKMEEDLALNEKLRSLGTLAGGIAHDFNNILTGISGNLSLLRLKTKTIAGAETKITRMEEAVERGRGLSHQLIAFASGGAPSISAGDIASILHESSAFVLRGSKTICRLKINDNLYPCMMDPDQISQAVENLVINASQAMPEGGEIIIRAENATIENDKTLTPGAYVHIKISDNGPGIAAKNLPRIFDPYFTTKKAGSGLGLASCHTIIGNHQGKITVESEPGQGATFSVLLPAAPEATINNKTEPATEAHQGQGKILIMDDEESIREVLEEILRNVGYTPTSCKDGGEALNILKKDTSFVAAIFDLTVPGGMGGRELCEALRDQGLNLPLIAASGYSDDPIMADPKKFGFAAGITKPFAMKDITRVLNRIFS